MRNFFTWIDPERRPSVVFGLVLSGIYILASLGIAFAFAVNQNRFPAYILEGIDLLGYFCIVILIFSAGKNLSIYYLDRISLLLIIIFPGFLSPVPGQLSGWMIFLLFIIPIIITFIFFQRLRKIEDFQKGNLRDLAIYFLLGTIVAIIFFLVVIKLWYPNRIQTENLSQINVLTAANELIGTLSTSAAIEETLFRGFLMGFLINKKGIKPWIAITIQGMAFWILHLYQYSNPFLLQITTPLYGFTIGWITYKTKSITPGIFAHAVYNALFAVF